MQFFEFFQGNLIWLTSLAILCPFNVPLAALAYRILRAGNPLGMPVRELWFRSFLSSLLIALGTFVLLVIDFYVTDGTGVPAGPMHLVTLMVFVTGACWILFHFFGFEEPLDAVNMFFLYLYMPLFVIWPIHTLLERWKLGIWRPFLGITESWIKTSS